MVWKLLLSKTSQSRLERGLRARWGKISVAKAKLSSRMSRLSSMPMKQSSLSSVKWLKDKLSSFSFSENSFRLKFYFFFLFLIRFFKYFLNMYYYSFEIKAQIRDMHWNEFFLKHKNCRYEKSKFMLTCSFKGFIFQFCQYIVPKQENFKIFCPFKITRLNIRNFVVTKIKMQQPLASILYNIKLLK